MFLGYSELLNALGSGSTTKLTICNKQVGRQAFEDTVLLPQRGDSLDGFVNEFNGMLESKISGSAKRKRSGFISAPQFIRQCRYSAPLYRVHLQLPLLLRRFQKRRLP